MRILFNDTDGRIFYAVADAQQFYFIHTTNIILAEFEIDEIGPNAATCVNLIRTLNLFDVEGDPKYSMIDNAGTWELHKKNGWEEAPEDV